MKFAHTMRAIGEGVFPMPDPHQAKVIFVNISHALYPNNDTYAYKAQDAMIKGFNAKQIGSGLPTIET